MINLTNSAKKTYIGLILFNTLMIFLFSQVFLYYHNNSIKRSFSPKSIQSLIHLTHKLQKSPKEEWQNILINQKIPLLKITLSEKPAYKKNALLNLNSLVVLDLIKSQQKLELSVYVAENSWLNIKALSPIPTHTSLLFSIIAILMLIFLFINFLFIYALNQPIQTIIQSLSDNNTRDSWHPIPLTGSSDQKAILKKINALQNRVSKLLSNHTRVVSAISHDLRTPLTRLKLRTEYLNDDIHYKKIINDIDEMEAMIKEALDYLKDSHNTEKFQKFDLVAMINSIYEDTLDLHKNIKFSTKEEKLVYLGAVNLLKRAINNIINNAIYYGEKADIELLHDENNIIITVTDSGPGIPKDDLDNVFNPFYRAERSRSRTTGGSGLGLTIAKEVVNLHKGSISLCNQKSGGLKVTIVLPNKV